MSCGPLAPAVQDCFASSRLFADGWVDAGVARSRADALAWCVRLVAEKQDEWLADLRQALESVDRGRDTVQALRLAQSLQPRDDTAIALDDAIGKYGFHITETTVESDSVRPRICATNCSVVGTAMFANTCVASLRRKRSLIKTFGT